MQHAAANLVLRPSESVEGSYTIIPRGNAAHLFFLALNGILFELQGLLEAAAQVKEIHA